ncbi:MAG: hypothetical protein HYR96_15420 [Deltaproteobacteria bacterium]|nr:hypothetical protein [Deltaproteobacteria bacterium]MBI3294514.1 hypothetical protein [Deltaproteobacteria bacterium]
MNPVLIFASVLLVLAADDHSVNPKGRGTQDKRGSNELCPLSSSQLAAIANGDTSSFNNIPAYLTQSACTDMSFHTSSEAIPNIRFKDSGPYGFLKQSAASLMSGKFENADRIENNVRKRLPLAFRESPLSGSDFSIVGQLAALSPALGKEALGQIIQTELVQSNQSPSDLAFRLVRYGTDLDPISAQLAVRVEEMTTGAQGDSLASLLKNLSGAASRQAALIPAFNKASGAVKSGVMRAEGVYGKAERLNLSSAVFYGISGAALGAPGLEPGMISLNDALALLTSQHHLRIQSKMVKDSVLILAKTNTQPALARSLASSMTEDWLSWNGRDRELLLSAGGQYYDLALAIQERYMHLVDEQWNLANRGDVAGFNEMKRSVLVPLGEAILGIDPDFISPEFVSVLVRNNLAGDTLIEQRLPKLVLDRYHHNSELFELLNSEKASRPVAQAIFSELANSIALQLTYVPALNGWIERQSK